MKTFVSFCIQHRFLVIFGVLLVGALGVRAAHQLPIDAVPDVTNVQVQVLTTAPALGPIEADAELRLLYGNGFGIAGTRGFLSASAGLSTIRAGNDEIRYDLTVGVNAGRRILLMGQAFNVAALAEGGGIAYSATKLGGSAMLRLSPAVGVLAGYYGGVSGKNTARERTFSIAIWLTHDPQEPVIPTP